MIPITILALAVAAPVPKLDAKKVEEVYGKLTDPDTKCKCELTKEGGLRVVVPSDQGPTEQGNRSRIPPLLARAVEGEFELTVRVAHAPPKGAEPAKGASKAAIVTAGVALVAEENESLCVLFAHNHRLAGDKWKGQLFTHSVYKDGSAGSAQTNPEYDAKPVYLRLTRRGNLFTAETSGDGKKWEEFTRVVHRFGHTVTVGPVAYQNTTADYEVVFDQYEIKPLNGEKK